MVDLFVEYKKKSQSYRAILGLVQNVKQPETSLCYSIHASVPKRISAHNHDLVLLHCLTLIWSHLDVPKGLQRNHSSSKPHRVECCKSQIRWCFLFNQEVHWHQILGLTICIMCTYWLVLVGAFFSGLTFSCDPDLVIRRLRRYFLFLSLSLSLSLFLHNNEQLFYVAM